MTNLLITKSLEAILSEAAETGEHTFKRTLGPLSLIALGIGAIIGTGIFVLTGPAARMNEYTTPRQHFGILLFTSMGLGVDMRRRSCLFVACSLFLLAHANAFSQDVVSNPRESKFLGLSAKPSPLGLPRRLHLPSG